MSKNDGKYRNIEGRKEQIEENESEDIEQAIGGISSSVYRLTAIEYQRF